jgi:hypothetical protein
MSERASFKRHTDLAAQGALPTGLVDHSALLNRSVAKPLAAEGRIMPQQPENAAGDPAPATGTYEELNIFGSPTGVRVKSKRRGVTTMHLNCYAEL